MKRPCSEGKRVAVVWFRQDLRLADNPALRAAAAYGRVLPLFIWAPEEEGKWAPGAASNVWLQASLKSLAESLAIQGASLVVRRGPSVQALLDVCRQAGASAVYWNNRYEPHAGSRDEVARRALLDNGIPVHTSNAALLNEPWEVMNKAGKPFRVFTPFWRECGRRGQVRAPHPAPAIKGVTGVQGLSIDALGLMPGHPWAERLLSHWTPGERGAGNELDRFIRERLGAYASGRETPGTSGTSRLSPHLHFGEIGPRQVWHALETSTLPAARLHESPFARELGWREFAYHLLHHFPHTPSEPLRAEFASFPWKSDPELLKAWQAGRTGIPLVDAGMRELWATGWMHNRVRMIVGSFLVKNLLQPWQSGAEWFWDTLMDADLASNTLGWQWVAGCGADAAPFFRIFNPVIQGRKFDPEGAYVKKWIPELAPLPPRWVHEPDKAPGTALNGALLPEHYLRPVTGLFTSREQALQAYARIKAATKKQTDRRGAIK